MNNQLVKINNNNLEVKEYKGQRVVTFKDIDLVHERAEGTAKRNFNTNKVRFLENIDYYFVKPSDVEEYEIRTSEINNAGTYLITESGYLMLVKSLTDDLAWDVQRQLVDNYFRIKQIKQLSPLDELKLHYQVLETHEEKLTEIDSRVDNLENNMVIDYGQAVTIKKTVDKKVISVLYGFESPAYLDMQLRKRVYSAIWKDYKGYFNITSYHNTLKKDFGTALSLIRNWVPSGVLLREIEQANRQIAI